MKKILSLLFLLISIAGFSQDHKKTISEQFVRYNELIKNKQLEKAMDYVNDDFFTIFPKDKLIEFMQKMFESDDMEYQFGDIKITDISELKEIDRKVYAKMKYVSPISIKFKNDSVSTDGQSLYPLVLAAFETTFGEGNVQYDSTTNFFHVKAEKTAIASSDDKKQHWKFIVAEEKQKPFLKMILPEELLKE